MDIGTHYLEVGLEELRRLKRITDRALAQMTDEELHARPGDESNSIAVTMKHMAGNMRSRWTDFLTTDGEKAWRHRDGEFEEERRSREEILADWESGWAAVFDAVANLRAGDLGKTVWIRGEPHTVLLALQRQIAHYGYHVGQIVYLARQLRGAGAHPLSIPRGESDTYNRSKGHLADT